MVALLTADTLVVSQRAKLVELTNQYDIWDPQGVALGFIDELAQSRLRKTARLAAGVGFAIVNRDGREVARIDRRFVT